MYTHILQSKMDKLLKFTSSIHHIYEIMKKQITYLIQILQYMDFFSSILAFWMTLIAMAELPNTIVSLCHMTGVFIITFGVQINRMCLINILIPLSLGIIIPVI